MRLFTALWLPADVVASLQADTAGPAAPRGWRLTAPRSWHITLAFHGEVDAGVHARRLERTAHGAPAPVLRLVGSGAFPRVRWAGVETGAGGELTDLVAAAGGDRALFVAHVTVLRMRARPGRDADPDPVPWWAGHTGRWWTPPEVLLVASEPAKGGPRYQVVHRVPLAVGPTVGGLPSGKAILA
ncbi:2'-5' RNA ligase family protein [Pseudonocardia sp. GCM10023141]|uniref:2'-5' RNA ligase family protein n=1 Tax=Pseudonocardia sp. GCM10023141 TaxID=3252653 RepID=UPI00361FF17C